MSRSRHLFSSRAGRLLTVGLTQAQRSLRSLAVLFVVIVVVFVVTRLVGDPARAIVGADASVEQYLAQREELGLDKPLLAQFAAYVGSLSQFDLGKSTWERRPVSEVIARTLPQSLALVIAATLLVAVIAVPLGILAARSPDSRLDRVLASASIAGLSAPPFWVGLMLVLFFSVFLGWLPTSGQGGFKHWILPVVTLALPSIGRVLQVTRSSMREELNREWIKTARLQGLSEIRVVGLLALRNALPNILTYLGWEFSLAIAGSVVIVEYVFGRPGIGYELLLAIQHDDIMLVQGITLVLAAIIVLTNILVDILARISNPQIRLTQTRELSISR